MSTLTRLAVFVAGLVVAFGAAWGVGSFVDPFLDEPVAAHDMGEGAGTDESHEEAAHLPGGLMISQDGYTLSLEEDSLRPGRRPIAFTITDPEGEPLSAYETEHEKE